MIRFAGSLLGVVALVVGLAAGAGAQGVGDPPATPPPADVIISPGDVITITVVGEPDLSRRVTVTDDGKVPVAYVGEVKVSGLKPHEAAAAIRKALGRYLRNPEVTVDLVEANRASVFGKVMRPGTYVLPPQARALDLIQMAGGFDEGADRSSIRILRKGASLTADLAQYAATGDARFNPALQAGDVVSVGERPVLSISVFGQVLRPGVFTVPVDARVMDAVQMAGGFTERADRARVVLLRSGAQIPVNLSNEVVTSGEGENPPLQAGDTITVPEKRMLTVAVLGQVAKPSVYQVVEGTTVAEVIALAGGIVEGADLSLAKLIHRNQEASPIDLRQALEDGNAAANIALEDGDTVSLPKPVIERSFGVLGAVRAGGYFVMERDRVTIMEALSRAGGPTATADLRRAVLVRRSGDEITRTVLDVGKMLKGDERTANVTMGPGDVLFLDDKKEPVFSRANILAAVGLLTSLIYAFGR
ncbi:MAG TPA: SLBB domain-containing protein [Armatimonadota bacterium]|nr:hypothetical protein [Armatimonadota bacterium]HOJ21270.1 SLBB domain-containing protein [Armatimonadota bacterium]HOM81564.1 SLBB domain-containing protein [Armatimonadota bacterium]HPO71157.1 SLBB domain-containing protein [Armatimonadota bacterium]HPT97225.1 SLBB domain-containing protein [Armatimonadota bacterium]